MTDAKLKSYFYILLEDLDKIETFENRRISRILRQEPNSGDYQAVKQDLDADKARFDVTFQKLIDVLKIGRYLTLMYGLGMQIKGYRYLL